MKPSKSLLIVLFGTSIINVSNAQTLINPDGISTSDSLPANSLSASIGASNSTSVGNWGNGIAGGNLLMGSVNTAFSSDSVFLGGLSNNVTNQEGSLIFGWFNEVVFPPNTYGQSNIVLGYSNIVLPNDAYGTTWGAIVLGDSNETNALDSWVIGKGNIGQATTLTVGTYALPVSDASFIVGTGSGSSARSNGLVIRRNGEVQIPASLVVGGSPALTLANAFQPLQSLGFVNTAYLTSNHYLKRTSGANANANTNAYIAMGGGAYAGSESLAIGPGANASANNSIALGRSSSAGNQDSTALHGGSAEGAQSFAANWGVAAGEYSVGLAGGWALGPMAISIGGFDQDAQWANEVTGKGSVAIGGAVNGAYGDYSYAFGFSSSAVGRHSYSIGHLTRTNGYAVSLGSQNLSAANLLPNIGNESWIENGALFELGNGRPNDQGGNWDYSNAITTLKNGQTTLTNKAWKANASAPLEDPSPTTDSGGNALVVEGHTVLKGKVIIEQAQGDISMGIYQ